MNKHVKIFGALSDKLRLTIVLILFPGERCVCEIERVLNIEQSRVSHSLKILKNAGIINYKKSGKWRIYYLTSSFKRMKSFKNLAEEISLTKLQEKRLKEIKKCGRKKLCSQD